MSNTLKALPKSMSTLIGTWLRIAAEHLGTDATRFTVIGLDGVPQAVIGLSDPHSLDMADPAQRLAWQLHHTLRVLRTGDLVTFEENMELAGKSPDDPFVFLDQLPATVGWQLAQIRKAQWRDDGTGR